MILLYGGNTMASITILIDNETYLKLKNFYRDDKQMDPPPYAKYRVQAKDCVITVYDSNKCLFQGKEAEYHASIFQSIQPTTSIEKKLNVIEHAGSDEVGTGDYFGPVCVCAVYLDQTNIDKLTQYKIQDSKAIKDETILKIAPSLMQFLPYSLLILNNEKYNEIHKTNNMNQIKAKLHNQAYIHLLKKVGHPIKDMIVDQFTPEASYYRYLKNEKNIVKSLHFETKAENKYLAVACASIIARYAFLQQFNLLEKHYDFKFLKGASAKVDENAKAFILKHGEQQLSNVAKIHFVNTNRILEK